MSINYKEITRAISPEDAKQYSQGIGLVGDFVDSLHRQGLLPERFNVSKQPSEMLAALGLTPEQVAQHPDQITVNTKAYVGSLLHLDGNGEMIPIFKRLTGIERIYTSFPGGEIPRWSLGIGGKKGPELERALINAGINIDDARGMLADDFYTLDQPEIVELARLTVRDLGFPRGEHIREINGRAYELGLDTCPAEVGPYQRLTDQDQKADSEYYISMRPIDYNFNGKCIFMLSSRYGMLRLEGTSAQLAYLKPEDEVVFSVKNS